MTKVNPSVPLTQSISPLQDKPIRHELFGNDEVEVRMETEDKVEDDKVEEAEGEKRQKTEEEIRIKEDSGKQSRTSLRRETGKDADSEQPGASLHKNDFDEGIAPNPPSGGEDFEVRRHKIGRKPTLPTKAEISEHYPLHLQ